MPKGVRLVQIAEWCLDELWLHRPDVIEAIGRLLRQKRGCISIASLFSGWCSEIMAARAVRKAWNSFCRRHCLPKFKKVRHAFVCENNPEKLAVVKRCFGGIVDHIFKNVGDLSNARAVDENSGQTVDVPRGVDVTWNGSICHSLSGLCPESARGSVDDGESSSSIALGHSLRHAQAHVPKALISENVIRIMHRVKKKGEARQKRPRRSGTQLLASMGRRHGRGQLFSKACKAHHYLFPQSRPRCVMLSVLGDLRKPSEDPLSILDVWKRAQPFPLSIFVGQGARKASVDEISKRSGTKWIQKHG